MQADYEGLTVGWAPVSRAADYRVSLNGYDVAGTTGTEVALRWFNDDMSEHFVQVRAVGPDGQSSLKAGFLRVTRPSSPGPSPTESTPTTTPDPTPTPSTSSSPTAEPSPTAESSSSPTAQGVAPSPSPTASATR